MSVESGRGRLIGWRKWRSVQVMVTVVNPVEVKWEGTVDRVEGVVGLQTYHWRSCE